MRTFLLKIRASIALAATLARRSVSYRLQSALQGLQGLFLHQGKPDFVGLVNEAADGDRIGLIGLTNEITAATGDGWALIPYGEHDNERGIQQFGRAQAEEMVGYFKNTWNRIKRAFVGMPIFRGHPDFVPQLNRERDRAKDPAARSALQAMANEMAKRFPDETVYGTIADMEVRENGLAIRPVITEDGAALVNEKGLRYFSPHWLSRPVGTKDGKTIYAPVFMMSIGLTDRPNIAGTSLVNTAPAGAAEKTNTTMLPKWLIELLGLANEATEEQARAAISALQVRPEPTALVNEQSLRTKAEGSVTELTGKVTSLTEQVTQLTAQVNEANAKAKTAATERNQALVDAAVRTGRIKEADKPVWIGRLDRDFAGESVALANEASGPKVTPRTDGVGDRKKASAPAEEFTALVNERMASKSESYTAAWEAVKRSPKGKALYEQMSVAPAAK